MDKLLMLSIGGVQNYISKAVSTKDLYAGSRIISDTVKKLYQIVKEKKENRGLLLQSEEGLEKKDDQYDYIKIPNYFIVKLDEEDKENLKLEEKWKKIIKEKWKKNENKDNEIMLPEDIPVFLTISDYDVNNEVKSYQKLYQRFHSHKLNRLNGLWLPFGTNKEENKKEVQRTCCMCGQPFWDGKQKNGEPICLLCNYKRRYGEEQGQRYASTLEVAKAQENSDKGKYYALIRGDIDDLGRRLLTKYDDDCDLGKQRTLIEKIDQFSLSLKDIITKKIEEATEKNLFIYNGGDDFLFFCPIDRILSVLNNIESLADNTLNKENIFDSKLTISYSVLIAHEKVPLRMVVRKSKEALDEVKALYQDDGKHGVALALINRSMKTYTTFYQINDYYPLLSNLEKVLVALKNKLSRSFIFELEQSLGSLQMGQDAMYDIEDLITIAENEIKRLLLRKNLIDEKNKETLENEKELEIILKRLLRENGKMNCVDIDNYFALLHILEKWAQETSEKGGD